MITSDTHYTELAAAYVRGVDASALHLDDEAAVTHGVGRSIRLARFKRNAELPRVRAAIGMLKTLSPGSLLDIGSGRGTFLWPLLTAFPWLQVTSVELSEERHRQLAALRAGGLERFTAMRGDATALDLDDGSFDGVTVLEVLEHLHEPGKAAAEVLRVAQRFVIASVPSKPDNNPEHIQLFTPDTLAGLFIEAGARTVKIEHVHNHMICLALR